MFTVQASRIKRVKLNSRLDQLTRKNTHTYAHWKCVEYWQFIACSIFIFLYLCLCMAHCVWLLRRVKERKEKTRKAYNRKLKLWDSFDKMCVTFVMKSNSYIFAGFILVHSVPFQYIHPYRIVGRGNLKKNIYICTEAWTHAKILSVNHDVYNWCEVPLFCWLPCESVG